MISRTVYWLVFPVLLVLFIALHISLHRDVVEIWQPVLFNMAFLFIQMLMVSAWFSFRNKRWINVTLELMGWGDILFLTSVSFYLSFLSFLFFYIISLVTILLVWIIVQLVLSKKIKKIPLAGLQALALIIFLANDWWFSHINVTSDYWLQQFLIK